MIGRYHEEDKEEDPKVRMDQLEHSIATLTTMVTQVLVAKGMEAPSTDIEHGEHKANLKDTKKNEKPKSELKTNTKKGECSYRKMSMPFCVEAKVDIKPYVGGVDANKLNHGLQ